MPVELYTYLTGPTHHVAWRLSGGYVSFHPGAVLTDLGSRKLPLPAGLQSVHLFGCEPRYDSLSEDQARYGVSPTPLVLPNLNGKIGAHLAGEFIGRGMPYVLWDPAEVGAINCVTLSILLFSVMLPQQVPQAWDVKWGDVFHRIRHHAAAGGDWIQHVFAEPIPGLMYVKDVDDLARDWVQMQGGPISAREFSHVIEPPFPNPGASS